MVHRRDVLKMGAGAAVVAGFAPGTATAQEDEMGGLFIAGMTGDQQVPESVDTAALGGAIFSVDEDATEIQYALGVANAENVLMAHIHAGAATENGPVVVWLYPSPDAEEPELKEGTFTGLLADGTITEEHLLDELEGESLSALVELMRSGEAYVNVHTEQNPAGEIRGQIHDVRDVLAVVNGSAMV